MKIIAMLIMSAVAAQAADFCDLSAWQDLWRLDIKVSRAPESDTRLTLLDFTSSAPYAASVGALLNSTSEKVASVRYSPIFANDEGGHYRGTCTVVVKIMTLLEERSAPMGTMITDLTLTLDPATWLLSGTATYTVTRDSSGSTTSYSATVAGKSVSSQMKLATDPQ